MANGRGHIEDLVVAKNLITCFIAADYMVSIFQKTLHFFVLNSYNPWVVESVRLGSRGTTKWLIDDPQERPQFHDESP
jgi:hypothetical protein